MCTRLYAAVRGCPLGLAVLQVRVTAEIAAAISGIDPGAAIERLSGDLTTKHRMVINFSKLYAMKTLRKRKEEVRDRLASDRDRVLEQDRPEV